MYVMDSPVRPVDESMLARVNGKTSVLTTGHNEKVIAFAAMLRITCAGKKDRVNGSA